MRQLLTCCLLQWFSSGSVLSFEAKNKALLPRRRANHVGKPFNLPFPPKGGPSRQGARPPKSRDLLDVRSSIRVSKFTRPLWYKPSLDPVKVQVQIGSFALILRYAALSCARESVNCFRVRPVRGCDCESSNAPAQEPVEPFGSHCETSTSSRRRSLNTRRRLELGSRGLAGASSMSRCASLPVRQNNWIMSSLDGPVGGSLSCNGASLPHTESVPNSEGAFAAEGDAARSPRTDKRVSLSNKIFAVGHEPPTVYNRPTTNGASVLGSMFSMFVL